MILEGFLHFIIIVLYVAFAIVALCEVTTIQMLYKYE